MELCRYEQHMWSFPEYQELNINSRDVKPTVITAQADPVAKSRAGPDEYYELTYAKESCACSHT